MSAALPRVSVCLLTYNRAHLLSQTLDSLLGQSHSDFDLIINDDRSTDDTEKVCREYARRDQRVSYLKNPRNLGYAGNQNAAILRATTDYVAIVHDGDVYRRDLIEKWTRALVEHPSAAFVFNALEAMDQEGRVRRVYRHPYGSHVRGIDLFDEMIHRPDSPIFGIVMVRRSCVESVGPFDHRFRVLADVDMWLRLLLRYDAAYIAEPLLRIAPREANHRNNSTNWTVRREHELIYALNTVRRCSGDPLRTAELRREIEPMLRQVRILALLSCLRHASLRGVLSGLVYSFRHRDFVADASPDSVHTWKDVACLLEGPVGGAKVADALKARYVP